MKHVVTYNDLISFATPRFSGGMKQISLASLTGLKALGVYEVVMINPFAETRRDRNGFHQLINRSINQFAPLMQNREIKVR